jgi:hypothetical protein
MSAVAARGTVEMLTAPERVKVSTDVPSQPFSRTHANRKASDMPSPANGPDYPLILRPAHQARGDFAAILDEPDFVKWQLSRLPTRAWLSRMALMGFGSVWALLAVVALLLTR